MWKLHIRSGEQYDHKRIISVFINFVLCHWFFSHVLYSSTTEGKKKEKTLELKGKSGDFNVVQRNNHFRLYSLQ